ncbi:MAG: hypothetical protein E7347_04340 [Clostridiales bacterium]|nr:hypothetical protein [Clostridiales bacterium]
MKLFNYFKNRFSDKAFAILFLLYAFICVCIAGYWLIDFNLRNFFLSLIYLLIAFAVPIAEYLVRFKCGPLFVGALYFLALGGITGSCFNLYTIIPFWDIVLHVLSGVLFSAVGFAVAQRFFGIANTVKKFFGCLVFALCFSLAIAVVWEIFEFICTIAVGADMMEDTLVNKINSYFLSGTHAKAVTLDGITKTVIYYGNGNTYTINGYLDLGLIDTLVDMIVCTGGALVFMAVVVFAYFKFPVLNRILIPESIE